MSNPEHIRQWIEACVEEIGEDPDKFTDWERDFIESVEKQFDLRGTLSEKQEETLERIYANKTD